MAQNNLNANCVHFMGIVMPETDFWCRLNLLENMLNVGFLFTILLVCENWKNIFSLHVLYFL